MRVNLHASVAAVMWVVAESDTVRHLPGIANASYLPLASTLTADLYNTAQEQLDQTNLKEINHTRTI